MHLNLKEFLSLVTSVGHELVQALEVKHTDVLMLSFVPAVIKLNINRWMVRHKVYFECYIGVSLALAENEFSDLRQLI